MISILQNLSELEKSHRLRILVLDCYLNAVANMAEYAVDLDAAITLRTPNAWRIWPPS
jgi:hypothetical protein